MMYLVPRGGAEDVYSTLLRPLITSQARLWGEPESIKRTRKEWVRRVMREFRVSGPDRYSIRLSQKPSVPPVTISAQCIAEAFAAPLAAIKERIDLHARRVGTKLKVHAGLHIH
jgi:hypothetical protein